MCDFSLRLSLFGFFLTYTQFFIVNFFFFMKRLSYFYLIIFFNVFSWLSKFLHQKLISKWNFCIRKSSECSLVFNNVFSTKTLIHFKESKWEKKEIFFILSHSLIILFCLRFLFLRGKKSETCVELIATLDLKRLNNPNVRIFSFFYKNKNY